MLTKPTDDEVISLALALDEVAHDKTKLGEKGLRWMCFIAGKMIRQLRPDLAFVEKD